MSLSLPTSRLALQPQIVLGVATTVVAGAGLMVGVGTRVGERVAIPRGRPEGAEELQYRLRRLGILGPSRTLGQSFASLPVITASLPAGITGFTRSGTAPPCQGSRWYGMSSTWTFLQLRSGSSLAPTASGLTLLTVALASSLARSPARSMSSCWMVIETSARR